MAWPNIKAPLIREDERRCILVVPPTFATRRARNLWCPLLGLLCNGSARCHLWLPPVARKACNARKLVRGPLESGFHRPRPPPSQHRRLSGGRHCDYLSLSTRFCCSIENMIPPAVENVKHHRASGQSCSFEGHPHPIGVHPLLIGVHQCSSPPITQGAQRAFVVQSGVARHNR
jgi:hypothetical protein